MPDDREYSRDDKVRIFLEFVEEYGDYGGNYIDFSVYGTPVTLGEAFDAALEVLREHLANKNTMES